MGVVQGTPLDSDLLNHAADFLLCTAALLSSTTVVAFVTWSVVRVGTRQRCGVTTLVRPTIKHSQTACGGCRALHRAHIQITDVVIVPDSPHDASHATFRMHLQLPGAKPGAGRVLEKRYSDFADLALSIRRDIYSHCLRVSMPPLPPKSLLRKFDRSFLESRRMCLQVFLNELIADAVLSKLPSVRRFCGDVASPTPLRMAVGRRHTM
ncbi:Aste57867_17041 [Aphanomyces stellatus]|uniref:Aste57867_17041 protein n=1 Tax=Aphanomyces stellatus TaxID=120398 RepID=A0A485L7L9_9STRA|nr:hypothetical protein As57867_016983 [Aphanomyces stellatus]VFT93802.1 Aste57867_17041 [Aphanomyces stellatus]